MDQILQGILDSGYPEPLKRQLIGKIITSAGQPQSEVTIHAVLELAVRWTLDGVSELECVSGFKVYNAWAEHNMAAFETYFSPGFLFKFLITKHRNPDCVLPVVDKSLSLLHGTTFYKLAKVFEENCIRFIEENPELECLRQLSVLMSKFKECIPMKNNTSRFCVALIHALSVCEGPEDSNHLVWCIKSVNTVAEFLSHIWNHTDSSTVLDSLQTIFSVISSIQEFEPSLSLGGLVQYLPLDMVDIVVKKVLGDRGIHNAQVTNALMRMLDWLKWPTAKNIDHWVIAFLKGLAAERKYTVLISVTEVKAEQVFENMKCVIVREAAFNILSHMLLSFQHSPEPFHKILIMVPYMMKHLKRENGPSSQQYLNHLAELLHCLMHLHAGFPDLYDPILELIKEYPMPLLSRINEQLAESKWTAQKSDSVSYMSLLLQKSETGKTGLINLGNTCFMNSVLQALYMCDEQEVLSKQPSSIEVLLGKLQRVFAFLLASQRPAYAPEAFLRCSRPPWFSPGHQQDCSEFLKYLLDQLHEQEQLVSTGNKGIAGSPRPSHDRPTQKRHSTLTERTFGGQITTTLRCLNCKNKSNHVEMFTDIPLAFPNGQGGTSQKCLAGGASRVEDPGIEESSIGASSECLHLNDLISYYLRSERLSGENQYYCERCGSLQDGQRVIQVTKAPNYLILTLLRFSYDTKLQSRSKIFKEVKYPKILSLPVSNGLKTTGSCSEQKRSKSELEKLQENQGLYSLCSVVVHSGTSSDCGHYYCYGRHSFLTGTPTCSKSSGETDFLQDRWYLFNDSRVSYANYESFSNVTKRFSKDTAYMLLYCRIDPTAFGKYQADTNSLVRNPPLRKDLREAVTKDNTIFLQEQELAARNQAARKRQRESTGWHRWQDPDDRHGPPGSCGGSGGSTGNFGDLDTSGARFVF